MKHSKGGLPHRRTVLLLIPTLGPNFSGFLLQLEWTIFLLKLHMISVRILPFLRPLAHERGAQ
jgi:hypothetical protein